MKKIMVVIALCAMSTFALTGCNSKNDGVPEQYQGRYTGASGVVKVNSIGAYVIELYMNDFYSTSGIYYDSVIISNDAYDSFDYFKNGNLELTTDFHINASYSTVNGTITGKMQSNYLRIDGTDFALYKAAE